MNVGFVERIDSRTAKIRVYERGAGETLACGTGTSAAMASGCLRGFFDDRVEFAARGGRIACAWRGPATSLYLIGPAEVVFVGTISLDYLIFFVKFEKVWMNLNFKKGQGEVSLASPPMGL